MSKPIRILWAALTAGSLLVGAVLAAAFWQAYPQARHLADRLARDGSMDSFTPGLFARLELPMRILGPCLILLGLAFLFFRPRVERLLEKAVAHMKGSAIRWYRDFGLLGHDLAGELSGISRWGWAFVLAVALLGAGLRWSLILRPMFHDEAYTYEAFASESLKFITSDYHLPNNHVLHTILVFISTRLLGIAPWAVRLPAYLAGALSVPFAFLLARKLYGNAVGALSASLIAVFPVLLDYSTNARGYTLVVLLTLVLLLLAVYVQRHRNLAAWSLIVVCGALGFYTVPIMLYPFGGVFAWLFLSTLAGDFGDDYDSGRTLIRYLVVSGGLTIGLTGILYLPIIRSMGLGALTGNTFVQSLPWNDFRQTAVSRLQDTWREWSTRLPDLGLVYALGGILSLALHRRITRGRIPMQAAFLLWITVALLVQRPNPWAKIWLFLVPLGLIWVSAGLLAPFQMLQPAWLRGRSLATVLATVLVMIVVVGGTGVTLINRPAIVALSGNESVALYLKDHLQPEDVVVVRDPDDAPLWYYLRLHGVPGSYVHGIKNRPFERGYVIVNTAFQQTIEDVINTRGPDLVFFNLDTAMPVAQYQAITIYKIDAYPERVNKAYALK